MKHFKNIQRTSAHKKTAGLALLEILIAIGILGIIAAGVALLATRTFAAQKIGKLEDNVLDTGLTIVKTFSPRLTSDGYGTDETKDLVGSIVAGGIIDEQTAKNQITGVRLKGYGAASEAGGARDTVAMVISGLNRDECVKVITGSLAEQFMMGWNAGDLAPTVGGDEVGIALRKNIGPQVNDPEEWNEFCTDGSGRTNTVVVGFK